MTYPSSFSSLHVAASTVGNGILSLSAGGVAISLGSASLSTPSLTLRFSVGAVTVDSAPMIRYTPITVPLTLVRLASGTALTDLVGGVALAPGDLPPGAPVSLYVGAAEVNADLLRVGRPHDDGSASMLRVYHRRSMTNGTNVSATLKIGVPQTLTATYVAPTFATMTATAGVWQTQAPVPGLIISNDSVRTCASGVLGLLSVRPASIPTSPSWMPTVEARWDSVHDAKWTQYPGVTAGGGYGQYDPAYQNLVRWARTGSTEAYLKAIRVWGIRRSEYYAPNDFNIPSYLMHHQGVALACTMFADDTARSLHRSKVTEAFCNEGGYAWINQIISSSDIGDARTAAGTLWALIALDRCGDGLVVTNGFTTREWIRKWTLRIMAAPQWVTETTGQVSYKSATDTIGNSGSGTPAWSNNFQNALLCEVLGHIHDRYLTDATEKANVKTRITECMEWMWQTQRFPEGTVNAVTPTGAPSTFTALASRAVTGYAGTFPIYSVDLHGLWLGPMMWLAQNVNRSTWQTRADVLLEVIGRQVLTGSPPPAHEGMDGINAPYMAPSETPTSTEKVCNETFLYMGRVLAGRA